MNEPIIHSSRLTAQRPDCVPCKAYPPPPLRKQESQANNSQTRSWYLDKAVLVHDTRHQKNVCFPKSAHTSP